MNLAATLAIEHLDSRTASQDLDKLAREIPEFREYLVRHARDEARHAETILEIIAETGIVPDVEAAQETIAALHAAGLGWDK